MCQCGCHQPMGSCQMRPNCHGVNDQMVKLQRFLGQGMNREQVIAAFVADHGGQDILAAPIDKGFNRLAWAIPYVVGVTGATVIGLVAMRWSRRRETESDAVATDTAIDPALQARLDDELRDLD